MLRGWHLLQPIRYDEAVTYLTFARLPWSEVVSDYRYPNNHILHTLLVKAGVMLFGNTVGVLRIPALLAGLAMLPLTWLTARTLRDDRVALLATGLVASSAALTLYSTNARGYALVVDATLLLLWLAASAMKSPRPWHWPAYAVVGALGLWTIPVMLYPLGGVTLWVLAATWRSQATRQTGFRAVAAAAGAGLLAAVCYMPVIERAGIDALVGNDFVRPRGAGLTFRDDLAQCLRASWTLLAFGTVGISAIVLLGGALAESVRDIARRHLSPLLTMLLWVIALALLMRRLPFARVWLFLIPMLAMAAASAAVRAIEARWPGFTPRQAGATGLLVALLLGVPVVASRAIFDSPETGVLPDAREIVEVLKREVRQGDHVSARVEATMPLAYWADRLGFDAYYLHGQPAAVTRYLAVINHTAGETLDELLRLGKLPPDRVVTTVLGSWPSADLVAITLKP